MKQVAIAVMIIIFAISLAAIGIYADFSDTEISEDNSVQTGSIDLRLADYDEFFGDLSHSVTRTWYYAGPYPPGMAPGDSLESAVYLQNIGSLVGDHLDVDCYITNKEIGNDTDAEELAENEILITYGGGIDNDIDGDIDEDPVDGVDNDGDGLVDEDPDPATGPIPDIEGRGVYDKDRVMIINYMKYQNSPPPIDIVWNNGTSWDPNYIDDIDGDGKITLHDFENHGITDLPPPETGISSLSMKVTFGDAAIKLNEYQGDQTQMTLIFALFQ